MTDTEEQRLLAMGNRMADAEQSLLQPACVRQALLGLDMQSGPWKIEPITLGAWLQLEEIGSPFLTGEWPEDEEEILVHTVAALNILCEEGCSYKEFQEEATPEIAVGVKHMIALNISMAMGMALTVKIPPAPGAKIAPPQKPGGFGWMLPLYTRLRLAGFSHRKALKEPVGRAFGLMACRKYLEGGEVDGLTYAQREGLRQAQPLATQGHEEA